MLKQELQFKITIKRMIDTYIRTRWNKELQDNGEANHTKELYKVKDKGKEKKVLGLARFELSRSVELITGQGTRTSLVPNKFLRIRTGLK